VTHTDTVTGVLAWEAARRASFEAGRAAMLAPVTRPLTGCDGMTLATDLCALTDLPAFPTSSIDGYALRGPGPWRVVGRVLAGRMAPTLDRDGECMEIATGAMVPAGTDAIVRVEESTLVDGLITGKARADKEWRIAGEEARLGDVLLPAGSPVTPGLIGLAAASGHDELAVRPRPKAVVLIFGDELLTEGLPADGRIRDALGPQLPAWLSRLGVDLVTPAVIGPIDDTLDAHVAAIRRAQATGIDLILTTGGTMHGPVDYLHGALAALGAHYDVNTVEVRPGFPMLLASVPTPSGGTTILGGLPGNPQSAVIGLVSLVVPALAGLTGRDLPALQTVELGAAIPGRGGFTHLSLVRVDGDGRAHPVPHVASSMLRGLAQSAGFAVIAPGTSGSAGDRVPLVPLPFGTG
jgi:molybdopterin molybdotransferase